MLSEMETVGLRESEEMQTKGFMVLPFPQAIKAKMRAHLESYIHRVTNHSGPLLEALSTLSDEQFVQYFKKPLRMFPDSVSKEVVSWVESRAEFLGGNRSGINYVSREEREGNPALHEHSYDLFWRCVRPGKADVGAAHADFQFWEMAKGTPLEAIVPFDYDERWKIWMPLLGCEPSNSLQVIPGSHLVDLPLEYVQTKSGLRPTIADEWLKQHSPQFICPLTDFTSQCILFHDKLVHKGPANNTKNVRISAEFTILLQT